MIKAIFFDIDGTLVSFDTHAIPTSAQQALELCKAKGIKLFVATGRPPKVINNLNGLTFDGTLSMNGSLCYEGSSTKNIIHKDPISREDTTCFSRVLTAHRECGAIIADASDIYICNRNEKVEEALSLLRFPVLPDIEPEDIASIEMYQISPFFSTNEEVLYLCELKECESHRWYPTFTDMVRKGSSKQRGIDEVLKYYKIELSETMSFGDGGNDICMLEHTAIGVAMGNANEEVKACADYITSHIDEDGVRNALKHYGVI